MSHSCYKLTLFDGLKERVIVSSIKKYYTPEQLVGKKIIVVANLKPARFTGVTSEGMLLAGTNNACGCQIVFVDDCVPRARASADCKSKIPVHPTGARGFFCDVITDLARRLGHTETRNQTIRRMLHERI